MAGTGLGYEEGTGEIDVDEMAEHCVIVVFGFDVRAVNSNEPDIFFHSDESHRTLQLQLN